MTIRAANESDIPVIYQMLRESAIAQSGEERLCVNPANLLEDGFGPHPRFQCLIAEVNGEPAGLALYFMVYSTWSSRSVLYLEDLYVAPAARRQGVAHALLSELAAIAKAAGCSHARWLVHNENFGALSFYAGIGAELAPEWSLMRMESEALERLASGSTD